MGYGRSIQNHPISLWEIGDSDPLSLTCFFKEWELTRYARGQWQVEEVAKQLDNPPSKKSVGNWLHVVKLVSTSNDSYHEIIDYTAIVDLSATTTTKTSCHLIEHITQHHYIIRIRSIWQIFQANFT